MAHPCDNPDVTDINGLNKAAARSRNGTRSTASHRPNEQMTSETPDTLPNEAIAL